MKRLTLAFLLLATPAMAQQAAPACDTADTMAILKATIAGQNQSVSQLQQELIAEKATSTELQAQLNAARTATGAKR